MTVTYRGWDMQVRSRKRRDLCRPKGETQWCFAIRDLWPDTKLPKCEWDLAQIKVCVLSPGYLSKWATEEVRTWIRWPGPLDLCSSTDGVNTTLICVCLLIWPDESRKLWLLQPTNYTHNTHDKLTDLIGGKQFWFIYHVDGCKEHLCDKRCKFTALFTQTESYFV